jgi:hypothetical protein
MNQQGAACGQALLFGWKERLRVHEVPVSSKRHPRGKGEGALERECIHQTTKGIRAARRANGRLRGGFKSRWRNR